MQGKEPDWEERYSRPGCFCGTEPVAFLRQRLGALPRGTALDLALGEGRNALFLARHGFEVTGIDKSAAACAKVRSLAAQQGLRLDVIQADLESYPLPRETFDVVLCFHYLQRSLFPSMEAALKPGGALVIETYTLDQLKHGHGPRAPAHLLEANELYRAFRHLRIACYREVDREDRAVASLLAFKL